MWPSSTEIPHWVGAAMALSPEEAGRFYDRLGRWQDSQRFYEDAALDALVAHADLEHATAIFEFGCGTGRLAERLLGRHLGSECRYLGVDVSATMVSLARERVRPWEPRAKIERSDGSMVLEARSGGFDRFVATYVLDLLSRRDMKTLLAEAHRILVPGGLLCLVSLTDGMSGLERVVSRIWRRIYAFRPGLLGGCRPIRLESLVMRTEWTIRHRMVVTAWGIASEVLVAQK